MSDWPPASTLASSSEASSEQTSSTVPGAWYSNGAGFKSVFDHCDGAAQRRLTALESPRKAAEEDLSVEDLVQTAAKVFDVDDVVWKQQRVHDLVVRLGEDLVKAATQLLLRLLSLVVADPADHGVHRVVGAAGVDGDPSDATVESPLRKGARGPGVADEVPRLVDARAVRPVLQVIAVVAGSNYENVFGVDLDAGVLLPPLEMLRTIDVVVADPVALQIHNACRPDQKVERQVADELAAGHEVRGRVEVRAHVQGHRDLLPARLLERKSLDPADRRPRITRERWGVQREVLREVEEPHEARDDVSTERWTLPIALRGSESTLITRLGHL